MRLQGWENKLSKYLEKTSGRLFKWGKMDCLIFASNACKLVCGVDPMSKKKSGDPDTIRGAYSTKEDAYKLIKQHRRTITAIMDLHFDRVNPHFAQRGDVVLYKLEGGKTFGVIWGGKAVFKSFGKGLVMTDVNEKMIAWRVE